MHLQEMQMQVDDSIRRNEEIQEQQAVTERRANLLQVLITLIWFFSGFERKIR